ncbi:MAG TPA: CotH kinase family protein [Gemmatales bacterium]|nr:CotH kinase family protein [Gemmatales bacterium]
MHLCKVLHETPTEQLEEALKPILDIDNVLWFLALDNALINSDGYWVRASDYSIYLDEKGIFHLIPHDMNEAFRSPGGPGMGMIMRIPPGDILPLPVQNELRLTEKQKQQLATLQKEADVALEKMLNSKQRETWKAWKTEPTSGGPVGGPAGGTGGGMIPAFGGPPGAIAGGMNRVQGVELDPLIGLNDASKPLRSKLLAHPALRARYLQYVKTIAEKSLDWNTIEPLVSQYRQLIEKEVERDTHKLSSFEEFLRVYAVTANAEAAPARMGPPGAMNLKSFFDQRRKYLLHYQEKK